MIHPRILIRTIRQTIKLHILTRFQPRNSITVVPRCFNYTQCYYFTVPLLKTVHAISVRKSWSEKHSIFLWRLESLKGFIGHKLVRWINCSKECMSHFHIEIAWPVTRSTTTYFNRTKYYHLTIESSFPTISNLKFKTIYATATWGGNDIKTVLN